jgi:hypothetical protein
MHTHVWFPRRAVVAVASVLSVTLVAGSAAPSSAAVVTPVRTLEPDVPVELVQAAEEVDALFRAEIDRHVAAGEITPAEAQDAGRILLRPDRTPAGLPAVILGAAAGCAIGAVWGEGKAQLHKLAKEGRVDDAADIAMGATIDCIMGAVPGTWAKGFISKMTNKLKPKIKAIIKTVIRKLFG